MAEHLTRNEKVVSSILTTSSKGKNHCLRGSGFLYLTIIFLFITDILLYVYFKFDFNIIYAKLCRAGAAAGFHIAAARAALERYDLRAYEYNGA